MMKSLGRVVIAFAVVIVTVFGMSAARAADAVVVTVTGTPTGPGEPIAGARSSPGTVIAYRAYAPSTSVAARLVDGSFSMSLAPGPYVFVAQSGGTAPVASIGYAMVRKPKKHQVPQPIDVEFAPIAEASKAAGPNWAAVKAAGPKGFVVSVGRVAVVDQQGTSYKFDSGKEVRLTDAFSTDLQMLTGCPITVVEDREFGRFDAILAELKLSSSKRVDPATRVNYKKALKTLAKWAPRYRLQGTVAAKDWFGNGDDEFTAHLELVDLKSGQALCTKDFRFPADDVFDVFPPFAAREMMNALCGSPLPRVIRGTYSGRQKLQALYGAIGTFDGTVTFVLQNPEIYERNPGPPGSGIQATYIPQTATVHWSIAGGSPCSYTASASGTDPTPAGALLLEVNPVRCESRRYIIAANFDVGMVIQGTVACDGSSIQTPVDYAGSIFTPFEPSKQLRVAGDKIEGTYTELDSTWNWSLTAETE